MGQALGAAAFVAALLITIVLHEAGHFLTAKRFGMKATQFFVGFGPTMWSFRRGETEYGIKWILLGGYVRIVGYTSMEKIEDADRPRAFYRQPAGRRAVVIGSGVVTNFALAFVVLLILGMGVGLPSEREPTLTVAAVSACVPASAAQAGPRTACRPGDPPSPARLAGVRPGDRIVALDGRALEGPGAADSGGAQRTGWQRLSSTLRSHPPGPATLSVQRGGQRHDLRVDLTRANGRSGTFLGVTPKVNTIPAERMNPVEATGFAATTIGQALAAIGATAADLPDAIPKLFSPERAESAGGQVGSVVGGAQVSGQVFAADVSAADKFRFFLLMLVSLNVFVAVLNVLPLLPLDGGHLAVVCYERIRGSINRIRGRPDPGTVDMRKLLPVTYAVVLLLIAFGLLLVFADLINPLTIS
jgi:membrane-associated protease RseP (regulator of RpoE activity)